MLGPVTGFVTSYLLRKIHRFCGLWRHPFLLDFVSVALLTSERIAVRKKSHLRGRGATSKPATTAAFTGVYGNLSLLLSRREAPE